MALDPPSSRAVVGVAVPSAFISLAAAVRFRPYIGLMLVMASGGIAIVELARRRYAQVAASCAIAAWRAASVWAATLIPLEQLAKPQDGEASHRRLAVYMVSIGDFDAARWQLEWAVSTRPDSPPEHAERVRLASLELQQLIAARFRADEAVSQSENAETSRAEGRCDRTQTNPRPILVSSAR